MISRWASLELIYDGKSYYVIPDVILPYSSLISEKKDSIKQIKIPSIPGPFEDFVQCLYGGGFQISKENSLFYFAVGYALGINSLVEGAEKFIYELSINELVGLANKLAECDIFDDKLIQHIAKEFDDAIQTQEIKSSPAELIQRVRKSPVFNLHNPTLYGQYIVSRVTSGDTFHSLLKEYLNPENGERDLSLIPVLLKLPNVDLSEYAGVLTGALMSNSASETYYGYDGSNALDGFFRKTVVDGKSPVDQGIIELKASSVYSDQFDPIYLIDTPDGVDTYFCSGGSDNGIDYVDVIFKQGVFRLEDYVMEGHWKNGKCVGPIEWNVLGSNDGQNWVLLDDRKETTIVDAHVPVNFHCQKADEYFSQFRFKQFANSGRNNKRMILSSLEIFGSHLKE
jgi:hypothetical protein